jgi:hypothetical protein
MVWCIAHLGTPSPLQGTAGDTEICPVKGNRRGIVTFLSDDGMIQSVRKYVAYFERDNLIGTVALITDVIEPGASGYRREASMQGVDYGTWDEWIAMYETGHLDFSNHTQTHKEVTECTGAELEFEVNGAKDVIDSRIPGFSNITFVYPHLKHNSAGVAKVAERHYASRGVGSWGTSNQLKTPVADLTEADMHPTGANHFGSLWVFSNTSVQEMNGWADQAVELGAWAVEMWHGCDGVGWQPPPCESYSQHCAYVASKRDEIWNASFQQATKYIWERLRGTVEVVAAGQSEILLRLTDNLPDEEFDFPVTLRTEVPQGWSSVTVHQGSRSFAATATEISGRNVVYYDAVPDAGRIALVEGAVSTRAAGSAPELYDYRCCWDGHNLEVKIFERQHNSVLALHDLAGRTVFLRRLGTSAMVRIPRAEMGLAAGTYVVSVGTRGRAVRIALQ